MYKSKLWTPEQLSKMNEESFLIEMLDMFQYSPSNDDDSSVERMRTKLEAVETALKTRLEVKRTT
ncbi:MAG: hypothetical protein GYB41_06600 [Oceanospirillales bacterium]|uniref:Uncharacterized protein n=1 Tax=Marinobacterium halophilum TaxID=267374 RepID=A0A2P8ESP0_9GAMM|nr:hypothetical protein [Marinobacterium halophilum]MBR9828295.1 hypothetical protein [Oceanospirillales bacterium]PSL12501.1 hypothetical protein CLV44_11730 [Marinobacterium halophilum]